MANKNEDNSFNILIGFILIVFLALGIIWALSGLFGAGCPEGTFECDVYDEFGNVMSRCGCCAYDSGGQIIEACGFGGCPDDRPFHVKGYGCCPTPHPSSCPSNNPQGCLVLIECGDGVCCAGDVCEVYPDNSYECIPCFAGARCNPDNINSCCDGYSCLNGFCEYTEKCVNLRCTNYGENCKICDTSGLICADCEDNSKCYNTGAGYGVCKQPCDTNSYVCIECPSGCCNPDGTCANCLNNNCNPSQLGNNCFLSPSVQCTEICVHLGDGNYQCKSPGGCPEGTFSCNIPNCPSGCCDVLTGECSNGYENGNGDTNGGGDDVCNPPKIWHDGKCISPTDNGGTITCPTGFIPYGNKCISVDKIVCPPLICTKEQADNDDYCSMVEGDLVFRCSSRCVEQNGNYVCLTEDPGDKPISDDVPNWLQTLGVVCIEVCEDCKPEKCLCSDGDCSNDMFVEIYDLNNDGTVDLDDLEHFDSMFPDLSNPIEVTNLNKKYDLNQDGVIDENDRQCLLDVCGDGTCKYLGFEELGICITAEYFDNSFTAEQKISMGDYYKKLLRNVVPVTYEIDCSDIKSINRPFCQSFGSEFENIQLLRDLEFVKLDRDRGVFYSACAHFTEKDSKDYKFGMHIESIGCTNQVNVYLSDYLLYKTMSYGMSVFNNCLRNTQYRLTGEAGYTFDGDHDTYSEDVRTFCEGYYGGLQDCDICDICDGFDFQGENCNSKYNIPEGCVSKYTSRHNILYNELPNLANKCSLEGLNPFECAFIELELRQCLDYFNCNLCQEVYESAGGCDRCKECSELYSNVNSISSSRTDPSDAQWLLDKYGNKIHECVVNENIFSGNCMVYLECLDIVKDKEVCTAISFWSYSTFFAKMENNVPIYPKQLYCFMDTYYYDGQMGAKYVDLGARLIYASGKDEVNRVYNQGVLGEFKGFVNDCPSGILCSFFPEYCIGGIVFPPIWTGGITIGNTIEFDKFEKDPGSYSPGGGLEGVEIAMGDGAFGMGGALGQGALDQVAGPGGGWMQSQIGMQVGAQMGVEVGTQLDIQVGP